MKQTTHSTIVLTKSIIFVQRTAPMDVDESRTKTTSAALWQGANKRKARVIDLKWFLNIVTQPLISQQG